MLGVEGLCAFRKGSVQVFGLLCWLWLFALSGFVAFGVLVMVLFVDDRRVINAKLVTL